MTTLTVARVLGGRLADLMHLAKSEDQDFDKALATARKHFEAETRQ